MDENKTPIYAGVIGFCLSFVVYQLLFNLSGGGGFMTWLLAFVVAGAIGGGAFFAAQKLT